MSRPRHDSDRTLRQHKSLVRARLGITADPGRAREVAGQAIRAAAQAKDNPADLFSCCSCPFGLFVNCRRLFTGSGAIEGGIKAIPGPAHQAVRHALDHRWHRQHHRLALPARQRPVARAMASRNR